MKLRRLPEDFQVTELANISVRRKGPFSVYQLRKRGLGTLEAVDAVSRAWNLRRGDISYGGLKDTHAVTTQHVTIRRGPPNNLKLERCSLTHLGATLEPFTPQHIEGNEFQLVLRSMTSDEIERACRALTDVQHSGLPNYFDDQRFGSVGESGEFIAAAWVRGNYERALWLTFADANRFDRAREKEQKSILRQHWGDWKTCKQMLEKSHRRSIITFLDDRPGDFRGAWARVRQDMRSLYVAALQSHLWNEVLAAWIRQVFPEAAVVPVPLKLNAVPFPTESSAEWITPEIQSRQLPLPSARLKLEAGPVQQLVDDSLSRLGWTMRELRIKYPRDSFFSKGWRQALIDCHELKWTAEPDELDVGRKKLFLDFRLPRGSYATILVKRITVAAELQDDESGDSDEDSE